MNEELKIKIVRDSYKEELKHVILYKKLCKSLEWSLEKKELQLSVMNGLKSHYPHLGEDEVALIEGETERMETDIRSLKTGLKYRSDDLEEAETHLAIVEDLAELYGIKIDRAEIEKEIEKEKNEEGEDE